jgi:hypothetical protein
VAYKICQFDGRRCSNEKCEQSSNGSLHICKRHRNKFGHNKRRFLKEYDSFGRRIP